MLGVLGTIISMVFLSFGIIYANMHFLTPEVRLFDSECLLLAAVLCATDTVAVLTLVDGSKYAKLNSILFGEGITNDAVSILLYRSVAHMTTFQGIDKINVSMPEIDIDSEMIFKMLLGFCALGFTSLLLGVIIGLLASYILKKTPKIN